MVRKTARKARSSGWTPSPECHAAVERIEETARICAEILWGARPSETPETRAELMALLATFAMNYFLLRIDPADWRAMHDGPGSFGDLRYAPFPPGYRPKGSVLKRVAPEFYEDMMAE